MNGSIMGPACLYPLHSHSDKEDICFRVWDFVKNLYSCPTEENLITIQDAYQRPYSFPAYSTRVPITACCWVCVTISTPSSLEFQEGPLSTAVFRMVSFFAFQCD